MKGSISQITNFSNAPKMPSHQIDLEGLQSWKEEARLLFASSTKDKKKLYCTLNGTFQLEVNGEIIWQGQQPYAACQEYNKI